MKKIKYILAAVAIAFTMNAKGQEFYTNLTYDMSIPLGNTSDFISKTSFRGATFELGRFISDDVALDLRFSWHVFYEDLPVDTYTVGTESITGKQYRYINSFPITVGANYFFGGGLSFMPYAGVGLGAYKQNVRTDMGVYTLEDKKWHFGFYPEIGFIYEFSYGVGLNVFARYDYTLKSGDADSQSYLSFGIGFHFNNYTCR